MNRNEYVEHYQNHYLTAGKAGAGNGEWERKYELWKQIGFKRGMSVLDYGCGFGVMLEAPIGVKKYYGVDIAPEAIRLAREAYPDGKFDVFIMGQLDKLVTEPFDFVVAQSVFTHTLKDTVLECLGDIKQAMKPTGMAMIDVLLGIDNENDIHVRHYTESEWFDYLRQAQLKAELIGDIAWENGNTHTYYKVTHA